MRRVGFEERQISLGRPSPTINIGLLSHFCDRGSGIRPQILQMCPHESPKSINYLGAFANRESCASRDCVEETSASL